MAQEISNAEIKTIRNKEKELKTKIKDLEDLFKNKYIGNKDIEGLKLLYDSWRKAQITGDARLKDAEEKLAKGKELVKVRIPALDMEILHSELEDIFMAETELLTIPNRLKGQEMQIQDQIAAIGRNLKTMELIKGEIKKI